MDNCTLVSVARVWILNPSDSRLICS